MKTKEVSTNALDFYYEKQDLTTRECLFALKSIIMAIDREIIHKRKYQIPFFSYRDFNLGFLWVHRKKIIVGFIEDKKIIINNGEPKKDFITTLILDQTEDIPVMEINRRIEQLILKYKV